MPAVSNPGSRRSSSYPPTPPPHGLFWPMFILIAAMGAFLIYQLISLKYQLNSVTQAIEKLDGKVRRTQYEKAKAYSLANEVMHLAPKDSNVKKIAEEFKLQEWIAAQSAPPDPFVEPAAGTNAE